MFSSIPKFSLIERGYRRGENMGQLTAARVKSITGPGFHGDGGTLFLNVAPSGSHSWIQRLTIHGRRRRLAGGEPRGALQHGHADVLRDPGHTVLSKPSVS